MFCRILFIMKRQNNFSSILFHTHSLTQSSSYVFTHIDRTLLPHFILFISFLFIYLIRCRTFCVWEQLKGIMFEHTHKSNEQAVSFIYRNEIEHHSKFNNNNNKKEKKKMRKNEMKWNEEEETNKMKTWKNDD